MGRYIWLSGTTKGTLCSISRLRLQAAKVRAEGRPQSVNVHDAAALVVPGDSGGLEVELRGGVFGIALVGGDGGHVLKLGGQGQQLPAGRHWRRQDSDPRPAAPR